VGGISDETLTLAKQTFRVFFILCCGESAAQSVKADPRAKRRQSPRVFSLSFKYEKISFSPPKQPERVSLSLKSMSSHRRLFSFFFFYD
jgi:hypothetical protein